MPNIFVLHKIIRQSKHSAIVIYIIFRATFKLGRHVGRQNRQSGQS